MLHKPSIIKLPDSTFPFDNSTIGCASSGYTGCRRQFSCKPYDGSGGCIDCSYSTCGASLAGGGIAAAIAVGALIVT